MVLQRLLEAALLLHILLLLLAPPKGLRQRTRAATALLFIGGSTVAGSPLPPHFKLKSTAREDNKAVDTKFLKYLPNILGTYGCGKVVENE